MPYSSPEAYKTYQREYKLRKKNEKYASGWAAQKPGVKTKTLTKYEEEAYRLNSGCLIHPSCRVARVVFFLRNPEIPKHFLVCHTCDDPYCIEATHHFAGTPMDNIKDSVAKGRHSCFENVKLAQAVSPFGTPLWDSVKRKYK